MNETKEKLMIYRFISDENSNLQKEIYDYICNYIKKVKAQKKLRIQVLFK